MANKTVVLAIFEDEASADTAAASLKDSGAARHDAIGVLAAPCPLSGANRLLPLPSRHSTTPPPHPLSEARGELAAEPLPGIGPGTSAR